VKTSRLGLPAAVLLAVCTTACSALLDWSDFTGGPGDAGSEGEGGPDATADAPPDGPEGSVPDVVVSCGNGGTCAANAPLGWMGPVALYVGAGPAPSCDADAASLFTGGDPIAPAATCTGCSCGASSVSCADPVVTLFDDPSCSTGGSKVTASTSCSPILAAAATVAAPVATGSCAPSGGVATLAPVTWTTVARACPVSPSGSCPGGDLCVPGQPASTSVCVMQSGSATACPPGYTSGPQIFYTGVDDTRGCSACACGAATNAACTIASPAVDGYIEGCMVTPEVMLAAPTASCTSLEASVFLELVATPMPGAAGTCAASGGGPTGSAAPTGAASFCCAP
jgi:hypothetical protein